MDNVEDIAKKNLATMDEYVMIDAGPDVPLPSNEASDGDNEVKADDLPPLEKLFGAGAFPTPMSA
jgi:hypothetical protein